MALQADLKAHPLRAVLAANTKVVSPPPSKEEKRQRALVALERAIHEAHHALSGSEEIAELLSISECQAKAGDLTGAFQTAASLDEQKYRDEGLESIAEAQADAGDLSGARQTIERIQDDFYKELALRVLARALAEAGDLPGALQTVEELGKARSWDKDVAFGYIVEGLAHRGDMTTALLIAGQIKDDGRKEAAMLDIAVAQARAGDLPAAMQTVQSVHSADHLKSTLDAIGEAVAKKGDYRAALELLQNIKGVDERKSYLFEVVLPLERAGNVEGVRKVLAAMPPLDAGEEGQAKVMLLCTYAWAGDEAGAVKIIKGIKDSKERERAWSWLAGIQASRLDPIGAAKSLEKAGPPETDPLFAAMTIPDYAYAQYVTGRGGADQIIETIPAGRGRVMGFRSFAAELLPGNGRIDEQR